MLTLDCAKPAHHYRIDRIEGEPEVVQRLNEFGLFDGETVEVVGFAPLGDPIEIQVGGTRLSLRKREAAGVAITPL